MAVEAPILRDFLKMDTTDHDALLGDFLLSAITVVASYLRRAVITTTYDFTLDRPSNNSRDIVDITGGGMHSGSYPSILGYQSYIDLPMPPIQSVTSITAYAIDNTSSVYSSDNYQVDLNGGRIYLNIGQIWPVNLRTRASMVVRFKAGYGDTLRDIPAPIRMAIYGFAASMYDNRRFEDLPESAKALLAPYRLLDGLAFS